MEEHFMIEAYKQANKALKKGDIPVGAVVVKDGKIISRAYNKKEKTKDAINHAEIIAIKKACKKIKDWRLNDCELYVTLEPCMMCMGAAIQSRLKRVIYGAKNPNNFFNNTINNLIEIENYNVKKECSKILHDFFKNKRN